MFSKGKSALKLLENNPILSHFDVGRLYASGGPESVWKIYEGVAKADGKVRPIFQIARIFIPTLEKATNTFRPKTLTLNSQYRVSGSG